ncbi:hypothetical protein P3T39_004901 [Kitasatospora sp. GP82]|nr:hypothetical protein [Kitasatospora sp. GP82]
MQILRHSRIAVTMEICTHVPSEATRRSPKKPGKHISGDSEQAPEQLPYFTAVHTIRGPPGQSRKGL